MCFVSAPRARSVDVLFKVATKAGDTIQHNAGGRLKSIINYSLTVKNHKFTFKLMMDEHSGAARAAVAAATETRRNVDIDSHHVNENLQHSNSDEVGSATATVAVPTTIIDFTHARPAAAPLDETDPATAALIDLEQVMLKSPPRPPPLPLPPPPHQNRISTSNCCHAPPSELVTVTTINCESNNTVDYNNVATVVVVAADNEDNNTTYKSALNHEEQSLSAATSSVTEAAAAEAASKSSPFICRICHNSDHSERLVFASVERVDHFHSVNSVMKLSGFLSTVFPYFTRRAHDLGSFNNNLFGLSDVRVLYACTHQE